MASLTADHDRHSVRKVLVLFVLGLFVLAAFQSGSIVSATYDLQPGPWSEQMVMTAEAWHGWMQQLGLSAVTEWITEQVAAMHDKAAL